MSGMKSRYFRNGTGEVVHRTDCPRMAANAVPWRYVDGMTDEEVGGVVFSAPWLRFCGHCVKSQVASH